MSDQHQIQRLWLRATPGGAMEEQTTLSLEAGQGVRGDHAFGKKRHVTIVFVDDWAQAEQELSLTIDPAGRRANVLVSGGNGGRYIGTTLSLGGAQIEVMGEIRPCPTMEEAAVGLLEALKPNCRAGIWGRVLNDAEISPGDALAAT